MTLRELFEKKGKAYAAWKELNDRANTEKRALTAEETKQVDAWEKEIDDASAEIARLQAEERRAAKLAAIGESMTEPQHPLTIQARGGDGAAAADGSVDRRPIAERLRDLTEQGMSRKDALAQLAKQRDPAKSAAFNQYLRTGAIEPALRERAALQMDSASAGGFLIAPEQFLAKLVTDLDRLVFMRTLATVIPLTGAESLGVPTLAADPGDPTWTTELAVGSADSTMEFGKRNLTPHPLARYILVSKDLLRTSAISVEAIVRERLAYKFAVVLETAFMTGSGAGSPLGIFTASAAGISTGQDVSTGNSTTAITADGLINCKYALESQWLSNPSLRWVFHRDAVKMIRKLKDGEGQYLWMPGLAQDRPDVILNVPVLISEYAPNTFTTGQYVGIIGDLSYYWIAETMQLDIQRLVELGALTNQDYFIGRVKLDGMPIMEKAFARVKLG